MRRRKRDSVLTESDLTLAKAVEIAQNMEAAHNNAQAMKQFTPVVGEVAPIDQPETRDTQNVQPVRSQPDGNTPAQGASAARVCYRCGSNTHGGFDCIHKDTICHKYGKLGHLARVCRGGRAREGKTIPT